MLCIIFVFLINEHFVTQTYAETQEFIDKIKDKKQKSQGSGARFFNYEGGMLSFDQFDISKNRLERVKWEHPGSEEWDKITILADSGRWIAGQWWLFDLRIIYSDDSHSPPYPRRRMYEWKFDPEELTKEIAPREMTFGELWRQLRNNPDIASEQRKNMKLQINHKLAFPMLNLIVVLISLPLCLRTNISGSVFIGLGLSLLLSFSYYGLFMLGMALGDKQVLAPWLAIWYPNIVFLLLGGVLTLRMEK